VYLFLILSNLSISSPSITKFCHPVHPFFPHTTRMPHNSCQFRFLFLRWLRLWFIPSCPGKLHSSLKRLTFAFDFHLNKGVKLRNLSVPPLVGLLNECRPAFITLHIRAICDSSREFDATFLEIIPSVLTSQLATCQGLASG